jgi:hypothetical protein
MIRHQNQAIKKRTDEFIPFNQFRRRSMSKARDTKKDVKKKPLKSAKEKKKAKQEKKTSK